jgi:hypothetical protein
VGSSVHIEGPSAGSCVLEIILPQGGSFEVKGAGGLSLRGDLELVGDAFPCPPMPEFDQFLDEHRKDESLTNLTLMQWYRGLARFHLARIRREAKRRLR